MGRIRRGGYVFALWVGDHPPRHVHIYKDGRLIAKVELNDGLSLQKGWINRRIRKMLLDLIEEGRIK